MKQLRRPLVPVLFLVALLAGPTAPPAGAATPLPPVTAAAAPACGGRNLLADFEQNAAAHYRAVIAAEQANSNGQALLWKVEKDGVPASWLFGTMHMSDARLTALPAAAADALAASRTVALELAEIVDEPKFNAETLKNIRHIAFTDGRALDRLLAADELTQLRDVLERYQMPFDAMRAMKPWFVSVALALPQCELARKKAGLDALDEVIGRRAVARGQRVVGLETVAEQFAAFDSLSLDDQKSLLLSAVKLHGILEDQIETMVQLYAARRIGALWGFARELTRRHAEPGREAAELAVLDRFKTVLVLQRNATMARRAEPLLRQGGAFIAVGAMHLPDRGGLVDLLQQAGYRVTPAY